MASATLREQYTACCNAYADLLIKLFDSTWQDSYWIADNVGGILDINGEYTFNMKDIVYAIDHDMTYDTIIEWYQYNLNAFHIGFFEISLDQWSEGAPRISEADIELLRALKEEQREAEYTEGADSPNYGNAKRKFDITYERILNSMHIHRSDNC